MGCIVHGVAKSRTQTEQLSLSLIQNRSLPRTPPNILGSCGGFQTASSEVSLGLTEGL